SKADLFMGTINMVNPSFMDGMLDDVHVYDRALSDAEVQQLDECAPGVCLPVDHRPVATDDFFTIAKDAPATSFNELANDKGLEDGVTVTLLTQPQHGTATVNADNTIAYAPNPGYVGSDVCQYLITDSDGDTAKANFNMTVKAP